MRSLSHSPELHEADKACVSKKNAMNCDIKNGYQRLFL